MYFIAIYGTDRTGTNDRRQILVNIDHIESIEDVFSKVDRFIFFERGCKIRTSTSKNYYLSLSKHDLVTLISSKEKTIIDLTMYHINDKYLI